MSYVNESELQERLQHIQIERQQEKINREKLAAWYKRNVDKFRCKLCTFQILKSTSATLEDWTPARIFSGEQIIGVVSAYFGMPVSRLRAKSRSRPNVEARQIAAYFMRQKTRLGLREIGEMLGGRDHTTAIHSINTAKDLIQTDERFRENVDKINRLL